MAATTIAEKIAEIERKQNFTSDWFVESLAEMADFVKAKYDIIEKNNVALVKKCDEFRDEYNKNHKSKIYLVNEKGQITLGGTRDQIGKSFSTDQKIQNAILSSTGFLIQQIIICLITIPLFSFILALIINKILTPLRRISGELLTLGGDLTFRLRYNRNDEVGDIVKGVNSFLDKLQKLISDNKTISEEMHSLTMTTDEVSENASQGLHIQQELTKTFVESVSELTTVAESIAKNAEVAAASTGKANEITDRSTVQISEMIKSINNVASRVDTAVMKVNALNQSSQQIEMILNVISSISEQTTLLALNAACLKAIKTQNSTSEISKVLKDLQQSTGELDTFMLESQKDSQDTMAMAHETEEMLQKMIEITGNINSMIIQISSAAEEHSCVARKLNDDSSSISEITDQVHEMLVKQNEVLAEQQECSAKQRKELEKFVV